MSNVVYKHTEKSSFSVQLEWEKTDFNRKILDEHIFLPLSSDGVQVLYKDKNHLATQREQSLQSIRKQF